MSDLIDSDLEHHAMSEAFQNYKKLKTHNVNASDWTMAWNYARDFVLGIANKEIERLKKVNLNLYELNEFDIKLLNKLDKELEEIKKQLDEKDK